MSRTNYTKQTWHDLPEQDTPISADALSHIEDGIYDAANNRALKEIYNDTNMKLGSDSAATGTYAVAHGNGAQASGANSHAEGTFSLATETAAHAEGNSCRANHIYSHAEGSNTITYDNCQHVEGRYNLPVSGYAHVIGGGSSEGTRRNIETLDWSGNLTVAGNVTDGSGNVLSGKVNKPTTEGTAGQVLSTNGDGTTQWIDAGEGISSGELVIGEKHLILAYAWTGVEYADLTLYTMSKVPTINEKAYTYVNGEFLEFGEVTTIDDISSGTIGITKISEDPEPEEYYTRDTAKDIEDEEAITSNILVLHMSSGDVEIDLSEISPYKKVNSPESKGEAGDILSTNGDSTTQWINNIPTPPTEDGNYTLSCTVSGGVATYEWITA